MARPSESERRARILSTFRRSCRCREVGARERTNPIALLFLSVLLLCSCDATDSPTVEPTSVDATAETIEELDAPPLELPNTPDVDKVEVDDEQDVDLDDELEEEFEEFEEEFEEFEEEFEGDDTSESAFWDLALREPCYSDTDCLGDDNPCCSCTAQCIDGVCVQSCLDSECCRFKLCSPECELLRDPCRLDQHCPELLPFCTDGLCGECATLRDCDDSALPSCEQGMCRPLDCSLMSCPSFAPLCIGGFCHLDACGPGDPCLSARATCEEGICRLDDYDVFGLSCHFQVSSQGWVSLGEDWTALAPVYSSDGNALLLPVWY